MSDAYIYDEIQQERRRQVDDLGFDEEHDENHTSQWWQRQIMQRANFLGANLGQDYRSGLVKIGALVVAAIARYDRHRARFYGGAPFGEG